MTVPVMILAIFVLYGFCDEHRTTKIWEALFDKWWLAWWKPSTCVFVTEPVIAFVVETTTFGTEQFRDEHTPYHQDFWRTFAHEFGWHGVFLFAKRCQRRSLWYTSFALTFARRLLRILVLHVGILFSGLDCVAQQSFALLSHCVVLWRTSLHHDVCEARSLRSLEPHDGSSDCSSPVSLFAKRSQWWSVLHLHWVVVRCTRITLTFTWGLYLSVTWHDGRCSVFRIVQLSICSSCFCAAWFRDEHHAALMYKRSSHRSLDWHDGGSEFVLSVEWSSDHHVYIGMVWFRTTQKNHHNLGRTVGQRPWFTMIAFLQIIVMFLLYGFVKNTVPQWFLRVAFQKSLFTWWFFFSFFVFAKRFDYVQVQYMHCLVRWWPPHNHDLFELQSWWIWWLISWGFLC